jgi:hypothetical protein
MVVVCDYLSPRSDYQNFLKHSRDLAVLTVLHKHYLSVQIIVYCFAQSFFNRLYVKSVVLGGIVLKVKLSELSISITQVFFQSKEERPLTPYDMVVSL